ncbi:Fc.00g042460.m01.CDS01 [Cosmosporella sp. VM-42]
MASSFPLNQRPRILDEPLGTPTHGSGGNFTLVCSTSIAAPLATVLETLLDTRTYPSWNPFVPNISITKHPTSPSAPQSCLAGSDIIDLETTLQQGTEMVFDVHLGPEASSKRDKTRVVVTILEGFELEGRQGVRVAWRAGGLMPGWALRTERIQEFLETGDRIVEYRCWETFYGLLAPTVKWYVGKELEWGFGVWMDGLKAYSEKQAHGNGGAPEGTTKTA